MSFARCILLVLSCLVVGCGGTISGPTGSVRGTVHYKRRPVPEGRIEFVPDGPGHGKSVQTRIASGKYSIPALGVGPYRVQIRAWRDGHDYIPPEAEGNDASVEILEGTNDLSFSLK